MKNAQVIQCVREIRPGGGVCGVAYELDAAFRRRGLEVSNFTLMDLKINPKPSEKNLYLSKLRLIRDVIVFTCVGTLIARARLASERAICHGDVLFGKIYVNHGLHRAALDASGRKYRMLARNPVHLFFLLRESLRFWLGVHRYYVCFSDADASLMRRYYPRVGGKIRVIPNGVDGKRFRPDARLRSEFRRAAGLADSDFVVCFVGHEFERKGLFPLLRALAILPPNVKLIVAGGQDQMIRQAERFAQEHNVEARVSFLGVCSDVERVMNGSDAFTMPSKFEAWPLVGLEAMACGLPVLMKPTGGIPVFLKHGQNGYHIDDNHEDIAKAIRMLESDVALRARMGEAAIETASSYGWDKIAEKYLDLLFESDGDVDGR